MYLTQTNLSKKWMIFFAAALSALVLMFAAVTANAAPDTTTPSAPAKPSAPANLKQTSAFGQYAKISWDAVKGTSIKYQIDVSQDQSKWEALATVGNTYYTISKLETGKPYFFRVKAIDGTVSGDYSSTLQLITQPGYISEINQTAAAKKSVTISWSASVGAAAYDVYIGTTEDNVKYNQTVKGATSATIKKLKTDKTYIVKVVPFNVSPSNFRAVGFERTNSQIRTLPGKVTGLELTSWNYGSKNISVQWKAKENADGYQVKFYNTANKCVKTISTTGTKATFDKAASDTFYKVRVRAYVLAGTKKKYGAFNKTPIYPISQPQLTSFTQAAGKLTLGWKQVDGATSYDIYLTTENPNTPSAYTKVASVDPSVVKYELTKFGNSDITLLGNYYGYVVANKKVGSVTYSSKVTQAWYCSNN